MCVEEKFQIRQRDHFLKPVTMDRLGSGG